MRRRARPVAGAATAPGARARRSTPLPELDTSFTSPPWASAIWRTIVSPSPLRPSPAAAAGVAAPEALEDAVLVLGGDARALVLDRQPDPRALAAGRAPGRAVPGGARRTALASRLARAWRSAWRSPATHRPGSAARRRGAGPRPRPARGTRRPPRRRAWPTSTGSRSSDERARCGRRRSRSSTSRVIRSVERSTTSAVWRRSSADGVGVGERDLEVGADHRQRVAQLVADASWMNWRWLSKASSSRPSMSSKVSASSLQLVVGPPRSMRRERSVAWISRADAGDPADRAQHPAARPTSPRRGWPRRTGQQGAERVGRAASRALGSFDRAARRSGVWSRRCVPSGTLVTVPTGWSAARGEPR